MKEMNLEIITPSKSAYLGQIKSVMIPGTLGNFQVLFNHAPLLSSFEIGIIKLEDAAGVRHEMATGGGTVEVNHNKILVLADSVESSDEIDGERARKSYQRAKERLAERNKELIDIARAEASLQRAINRMKFAGISI